MRKKKDFSPPIVELISLGKEVAIEGGKEALKYFRQKSLNISSKSNINFDPVSVADQSAESVMRDIIMKTRPQDSILGEEGGLFRGNGNFTWVLDPIDGTKGFIAGQTTWTVLVSLNEGDVQKFGIIYQPFSNEMFLGSNNISELLKGNTSTTLAVRKCSGLSKAVLHTTDPYMGNNDENSLMDKVRRQVSFSRYSLDAYAYGLLAMGYVDLIIECSMKYYDLQAPISVIKSAGGIVSDWYGGDNFSHGRIIACGDKRVHEEALSILSSLNTM